MLWFYSVLVEESFEISLKNGYKLYSGLPSGSGIILAYILRTLDGQLPTSNAELDAVRLVEAFKFAYGERTHLGDHMFVDTSEVSSSSPKNNNSIRLDNNVCHLRSLDFKKSHFGYVHE